MRNFVLMVISGLLYASLANAQNSPSAGGCSQNKPMEKGWVVTIDADGDHYQNGYCYAGAEQNNIGFPCEINGTIAKTGDKVLGYTTYECTDIGHLPGFHFKWTAVFVAVKILSE